MTLADKQRGYCRKAAQKRRDRARAESLCYQCMAPRDCEYTLCLNCKKLQILKAEEKNPNKKRRTTYDFDKRPLHERET